MNWIMAWVVLCGISVSVWMWDGEPEDQPYSDPWLPCVDDWEPPPEKTPHPVPVPGTLALTGIGFLIIVAKKRRGASSQ